MKNFIHSILIITIVVVAGCQPGANIDEAANLITEESLLAHIEVLSSDEFEGRFPASRGEDLTIEYLVDQFEQIGLEPGMDDDSYIQEFPLLGQVVDGETSTITIQQNGRTVETLSFGNDFVAWPSNEEERVDISDAELLYVGYGIQAPEFDWDDYKDTDVDGKILVYKNSDPSHDPDIFDGESRLYYGRWSYKFEKAEEMGALGAIIIHTTPTAGYGWNVVESSWSGERFSLKSGDEDMGEAPEFNSWFTENVSETLFSSANLDLHEMLDAAADREFEPVPLHGVTLNVELNAEYSDLSSRNVIGMIEGNDPELKDEYVIFSAHHDHLEIAPEPVDGDSIYNGAWDNASGTGALIEMAKAFKTIESDLRRSVLFMPVGAEEMGLLGSLYWSQNPTVHPGKVSANINLDSMQIFGETEDLVLVGYSRNTITDIFKDFAEREGRTIAPDPEPEQGFFYRSDHFSFARIGIPAIYPNPGRDFIDKPDNFNEVADSVRAANYHALSDEINEYWDMAGMKADTRFIFKVSHYIINADEKMEWFEGDEFEAVRLQMLEDAQ